MIYAVNVPVATYREQALCAYQFLSFCAQFPLVQVSGINWAASTVLETNTGATNAASPSRFFSSSAVFTIAHVGKYIAVRDTNNPSNMAIVRVTAYISSTEVQCNAPVANFTVSASNLSFRVFDISVLPSPSDFFVFQNLPGTQPQWQARCIVNGVSTTTNYEVGPIGGWDPVTVAWLGPVTPEYYGWTTVAQCFFVADMVEGWYLTWSEDVGGVASNRNGTWLGRVGSTHDQPGTGFPADTSHAGILGSEAATVDNFNRATNVNTWISSGHFGNPDGSGVVRGYIVPRLTVAGTDILTLAAGATNPRTGAQDAYSCILVHRSVQAIRGYIPGLRNTYDSIVNRTLTSDGAVYTIGNGWGLQWNGKPVV